MCTRFTTVRVNMTGSSDDIGFGVVGRYIGLMPGGVPKGVRPSVGHWHVADSESELADLTVRGPTDEPRLSVLALGVEAL